MRKILAVSLPCVVGWMCTYLAIYFFHDKMHWIGRLPGDIRIERENFKFYFPITTMILLSLLLTLIVNIVRRFL